MRCDLVVGCDVAVGCDLEVGCDVMTLVYDQVLDQSCRQIFRIEPTSVCINGETLYTVPIPILP